MSDLFTVKAGSCMSGGDGRICALEPRACPAGTSFITPRMLEQGGGGTAHGGACATRDGSENVAKIGSCVGETDVFCASDESLCADSQDFALFDDRCNMRLDSLKTTPTTTLFGKCMADNTCYWSQQDCSDPASWEKPNIAGNSDCTCEEVRVGACVDAQGFYYCAVSEEACSSAATWIDASTLMRATSAPECFLCRQAETEPIQGSTPSKTSSTTPPAEGISDSDSDVPLNLKRDSGNGSHTAFIVGSTVGGGLLLLGLVLFFIKRAASDRGPRPSNKTVSDIPVENITDTSANQDIEDLSMDGDIYNST